MRKRFTTGKVIKQFKIVHGDRYDYSKVNYTGSRSHVDIICKTHGVFKQAPRNHKSGNGCPKCAVDSIRLTNEDFIKRAIDTHGEKYNYSNVLYRNASTKVEIECKIHGLFAQNPDNHIRGYGCPKCSGFGKNTDEIKNEFIDVHGDKYDYSLVEYDGVHKKVNIICKKHGVFKQSPKDHRFGYGCPDCSHNSIPSQKEVIKRFEKAHGSKYDYSLVKYVNGKTKIKIICKIHGVFNQLPHSHQRGIGCPKCSNMGKGTNDIIDDFKKVHGDKYNYDLVSYNGFNKKVKIKCMEHGFYRKSPYHHKQGQGCPKCSQLKFSTTKDLINELRLIHGDLYDYSKVTYDGTRKFITITCKRHGDFEQLAQSHLNGIGCAKCASSSGENKVRNALLKIEVDFLEQFKLQSKNRRFYVDFFLPDYNLFIEYHGKQHYKRIPFWHKTQKAFQRQLTRDQKLRDLCQQRGIDLLEIGYFDFDRIEEILSKKLLGVEVKQSKQLKLQF